MLKIIGVSGKMGSGKTTFADVAVNEFGATKLAMADALKYEVAKFLADVCVTFQPWNLWGTAEDKEQAFVIHLPDWLKIDYRLRRILNSHMGISPDGKFLTCTYRRLMQVWGTEYRRAQDQNYWVNKTIENLNCFKSGVVVIDDIRFVDEARMIEEFYGALVRIERPDLPQSDHQSEVALDSWVRWDTEIFNGGSLEEYQEMCREVLKELV